MLRLFIGNLPFATTELDLLDLFKEHGFEAKEVRVIMDRETGRSRGFAFAAFDDDAVGGEAMKKLDGWQLESEGRTRQIRINLANDRPSTGFQGNRGRGGGGGGGGGSREPHHVDRRNKHDKRDRRGRGDWD